MNDSDLDAILKQMATEHRPQLPSPGLIWFRAQIVRKASQKERIERPLVMMRGFAGLTGAVILLLLVAGNWGQICMTDLEISTIAAQMLTDSIVQCA
jgi:hypothetical protein